MSYKIDISFTLTPSPWSFILTWK